MPSNPFLIHHRFRDIDDLVQKIRYWNLEIKQMGQGKFGADFTQFGLKDVQVAHAMFNLANHQLGEPPGGVRTFAIFAEWPADYKPSRFIWRRIKIPKNAVMAFPPGGELDAICRMKFNVFTLSFSESLLANTCQSHGFPDLDDLLHGKEIVKADVFKIHRLRQSLHRICHHIEKDPSLILNPAFQTGLQFQLSLEFVSTLSSSHAINTNPLNRMRDVALKKVEDHLKAFPNQPHLVCDLCRIANVSERTLRYAFMERFGFSPKTYLKTLRLNGARRDLHRADPSTTTITDVATRWGFWHMSQFASDYRKLFAELPSMTIKRVD